MKKIVVTGFLAILAAMPLTTHPWATGGLMPYITSDNPGEVKYVKLAAQGGLCGAVFLKPKPNQKIALRAFRVTYNIFGQENREETRQDGRYNEVSPAGLWQRYDWAGINSRDHYRIYTFRKVPGQFQTDYFEANADEVLEVPDKQNMRLDNRHNRGCIQGVGGPFANYDPLYMDKA